MSPLPAQILGILAILLVAGCSRQHAVPADLEEVSHPELAAVEEAARRQLEAGRSQLETAVRRGAGGRELADAYGGLGELYHAYGLLDAAATCYRNAGRLDPESFLWPYYLGAARQAAGDLEAARRSLEDALARRGDDGPTRLRLAEVELALGDPAAAEGHLRPLLDDPRLGTAAGFGLGRAAAARGDAEAAVGHFERVLELQPRAGIVHHHLGMALRRLGREDEAAAQLERKGAGEVLYDDRLMARIDSLAISSGAYLRRGNRALVNGRLDEAAELFRQAVEADPQNVEARRNLALALLQRGDVDAALGELRAAVAVAPDNVWLHFDLGNAYARKGLAEKTIEAYRRAVEIAPDFTSAHFNLANTLIGLEQWAAARPHLEAALELEPGDGRARYLDAMARHHDGDSGEAIARLERLLEEEPANLAARQGLASIYAETGRLDRATAVSLRGLELEIPADEKTRLLFRLAELAWRSGRQQEAIAHWRRAVELEPASSAAHTALANGLQLVGERRQAREHFARAVELEPRNATAWLSEASLWILDGEFAAASERLERALGHAPDHPGLNHTLARLLATCPDAGIRDGRRALELARKAWGLQNTLDHAETIAMALAEMGQFEEAIKWQRGLVQRAAAGGDQAMRRRLASRLALYERRQPVRVGG